jgi:hypothetical protein
LIGGVVWRRFLTQWQFNPRFEAAAFAWQQLHAAAMHFCNAVDDRQTKAGTAGAARRV